MAESGMVLTRDELEQALRKVRRGLALGADAMEVTVACEALHDVAATARTGIDRFERAQRNERRLHALRVFLDSEGRAEFTVWANEMVELEGLYDDENEQEDGVPAMFDTLDDLLDRLWEAVNRRTAPAGRVSPKGESNG